MNSQNKYTEKSEQVVERQQHFGIRKLTIGAASVLLGTTLWIGTNANTAKADTIDDNNHQDSASQEAKVAASTGAASAKKVVVVAQQNEQPSESEDVQKSTTDSSNNTSESTQASTQKNDEKSQEATVQEASLEAQSQQTEKPEVTNEASTNIKSNVKDNKIEANSSKSVTDNKQNNNQVAETIVNKEQEVASPVQSNSSVQDNSSVQLSDATKNALQSAAQIQVQNGKLNVQNQNNSSNTITNSLNSIQQSAQQAKVDKTEDTQDFDLSKIALKGVKNNTNSDLESNLANVGNIKLQTSIKNTIQANQIDEKNAKKIANLYGVDKTVASSNEVRARLENFEIPSMTQAQMQQVIGQLGSIVSDPNVQNMAKNMIRGNWNGVLKEGEAAGQKLVANLGGIQGIIQNVTGKLAGSDWQKQLKQFNIPSMTQAQMQQVIGQLGSIVSDPNVQNMAKDMIRGNWNGVLKESEAAGQKLVANLGGIQGIIQNVTGKLAGSDWQKQLKQFNIPSMTQAQMQQVIGQLGSIVSDPNVQNMAKNMIRGNWNGVLREGEAAGQKLVANLGGFQGIIQNVTGKLAGNDWQKQLKQFNIPSMTQAQMQQVIGQLGSIVSDPNVQNMAKDMIRGNWNGVLKEGEAAGQKLVANLGGIQGIIQNVTGKLAGSDWQKQLKQFNIPSMTQAQMQQVIGQLGSIVSDPNVQNMAKDMIRGNWNGVLKEGEAAGQKLVANLGGIQGIIQNVTSSISQHHGTSWLDKFKNIIPNFENGQKANAQKLIDNIKNTNVKTLVTDVINGKAGKLMLDVIHYGTASLKTAYAKAQEVIKQVQDGVQKQVATIKNDFNNFNQKIGLQLPKLSWGSITIKVPKLQLPKFHFNLFAF
ncbi:YSIRK-type signal peptide-containing protein [Lactobacillus sp. PSON]|uniref:YSIRK-type signal peptide-containing protein n=1 Tax=Lactobacillus sp. PSON TaxID=3455454 RepID=UPI0040429C41